MATIVEHSTVGDRQKDRIDGPMVSAIHRLSNVLLVVAATGVAALMVVVVVDVALRNLGAGAVKGSAELAEMTLPGIAFLAMAYTQRTGGHVASGVLVDRLSPAAADRVSGVATGVVVVFLAALTWFAITALLHAWSVDERRYGVLSLPAWPTKLAVALGLLALTAETAVTTYHKLRPRSSRSEVAA